MTGKTSGKGSIYDSVGFLKCGPTHNSFTDFVTVSSSDPAPEKWSPLGPAMREMLATCGQNSTVVMKHMNQYSTDSRRLNKEREVKVAL